MIVKGNFFAHVPLAIFHRPGKYSEFSKLWSEIIPPFPGKVQQLIESVGVASFVCLSHISTCRMGNSSFYRILACGPRRSSSSGFLHGDMAAGTFIDMVSFSVLCRFARREQEK